MDELLESHKPNNTTDKAETIIYDTLYVQYQSRFSNERH